MGKHTYPLYPGPSTHHMRFFNVYVVDGDTYRLGRRTDREGSEAAAASNKAERGKAPAYRIVVKPKVKYDE